MIYYFIQYDTEDALPHLDKSNHFLETLIPSREQHKENMYRFIQKGAVYEPFRAQSAMPRPPSSTKLPSRPQTVPSGVMTENGLEGNINPWHVFQG